MQHLSLEDLARLIGEAPEPAEAEHLAECETCRAELDALRVNTAALAELPDLLPPPPDAWPRLKARLRAEGLIVPEAEGVASVRRTPRDGSLADDRSRDSRSAGLRVAAAAVLFLLGTLSGFGLSGLSAGAGADSAATTSPAVADATSEADPYALEVEALARGLESAEAAYLEALTRYAEFAANETEFDPWARLAALEEIVVMTREALTQAPADPIINGYHLTALAQREATIRRLAADRGWY